MEITVKLHTTRPACYKFTVTRGFTGQIRFMYLFIDVNFKNFLNYWKCAGGDMAGPVFSNLTILGCVWPD